MTTTAKSKVTKAKTVAAKPTKLDALAAFGFQDQSDRMKVLRVLYAKLGKPVLFKELEKAAEGKASEAVRIIGLRAKREKLSFKIERGDGTVTLRRT